MSTFRITSEFGAKEPHLREGIHTGIDIALEKGTLLRTISDGVITHVFNNNEIAGNGIIVKGINGKEYLYSHLDLVAVKVGDIVKFGDFLGRSGSTGNSTGPHLHFAIRDEFGKYIDPAPYLEALQKVTGPNLEFQPWLDNPGLGFNTRAEMDPRLACEPPDNIPWWDFEAKIDALIESKACHFKIDIQENTVAFLRALSDTVVDLSFGVALVGGGFLILFYICGMKRAKGYFGILQLSNLLIQAFLGRN